MSQQASRKSDGFGQGREKGLASFSQISELKIVTHKRKLPPALLGYRKDGVTACQEEAMLRSERGASAGFSAALSFTHSVTDKDKIRITKLKTQIPDIRMEKAEGSQ